MQEIALTMSSDEGFSIVDGFCTLELIQLGELDEAKKILDRGRIGARTCLKIQKCRHENIRGFATRNLSCYTSPK